MAFHRLYQQINAEPGLGVVCGSLSPGIVDTAGVQDHLTKARALGLPHVKYFDEAYKQGSMTPEENLMVLVKKLLEMEPELFSSKEWKYSEWVKENSLEIQEENGRDRPREPDQGSEREVTGGIA